MEESEAAPGRVGEVLAECLVELCLSGPGQGVMAAAEAMARVRLRPGPDRQAGTDPLLGAAAAGERDLLTCCRAYLEAAAELDQAEAASEVDPSLSLSAAHRALTARAALRRWLTDAGWSPPPGAARSFEAELALLQLPELPGE